jgi:VCBS repeat-containing protein
VNDSFTTNEDAPLNVTAANGVLKNDTDPNSNQTLTASVVTQPLHGTLTLNGNGSFIYTPTANYNGPDSFTYKVSDGTAQSQNATVNITVSAVNDAPVAVANSYNVLLNTPLTVSQSAGVLANDTDVEGATLTAILGTQPQHGTITLNANGSFTYTPTTGYTGPDSFTYKAKDATTESAAVTVSLTVAANAAPTAVADQYSIAEDGVLNVSVADGVLKNDTDPNSQPLTAIVVTQPAHGSVTLNANGSFAYTPAADYNGPDSFTYKANDGTLDSTPVTVSLTVTAVNDAPVAVTNSYNATENTPLTIDQAGGVITNDTDADGAVTLTAIVVTPPAHGNLTLNANGSFTYTPTTDYDGPDSFTYKANDGTADSAPVTVNITVAPAGEGEAEGEGGSASAAALLAYLASQDEEGTGSNLLGGSDDWADAVDEALA